MVAVYNKELLSWYLITLKLRETLIQNHPKPIEEPYQSPSSHHDHHHHNQQQQAQQKLQSQSLKVVLNGEPAESQSVQHHHPRDHPQWVISIRDKIERAGQDDVPTSWSKVCIYRVPHFLRNQGGDYYDSDTSAYVPQVVSIGPYHKGRRALVPMDRHKWRAVHQMLRRNKQRIDVYLDEMKGLEDRARACYEGPLSLSSHEFVEMLVLDGCFVLELFRGYAVGFERLGYKRNDPIFAMRSMMYSIRRDMMMIENQIPMFVLDRLMGIQMGDGPKKSGLVANLALVFLDPLSPIDEPLTAREKTKLTSTEAAAAAAAFDPLSDQYAGLHCLDLFRRSLLRKGPELGAPRYWFTKWSKRNDDVHDKRRTQLIHCATDLKEAGVKFKKRKTDRFWDIRFDHGVLHIPTLLVHDGTKSLFLNLVSFEQSHLNCSNNITAYVVFMDNLINNAEDVRCLHYHGIVKHWLGSDAEVADMFNRLCRQVVFDVNDSYLADVTEGVNRHCRKRWNAWRASLKHKYFYNPWAVISFLAAVFLLLMTFAQTFYSVYGYYNPPHGGNQMKGGMS